MAHTTLHDIRSLLTPENSPILVLTTTAHMIEFMMDSTGGGLFLNQLLYWSERTSDVDGWLYKSYIDWKVELRIRRYEVDKYTKYLTEKNILHTELRKINGRPTKHYRLDLHTLRIAIIEYLHKQDLLLKPTMLKPTTNYVQTNNQLCPNQQPTMPTTTTTLPTTTTTLPTTTTNGVETNKSSTTTEITSEITSESVGTESTDYTPSKNLQDISNIEEDELLVKNTNSPKINNPSPSVKDNSPVISKNKKQATPSLSQGSPAFPQEVSLIPKPTRKITPTPFDTKCAEFLYKAVVDKNRHAPNNSLEKWSSDFRILRTLDGAPEDLIKKVLRWYIESDWDAKHSPQAYSGKSFRDKFYEKLIPAMERSEKDNRPEDKPQSQADRVAAKMDARQAAEAAAV